jgi:hypothetical protein
VHDQHALGDRGRLRTGQEHAPDPSPARFGASQLAGGLLRESRGNHLLAVSINVKDVVQLSFSCANQPYEDSVDP